MIKDIIITPDANKVICAILMFKNEKWIGQFALPGL